MKSDSPEDVTQPFNTTWQSGTQEFWVRSRSSSLELDCTIVETKPRPRLVFRHSALHSQGLSTHNLNPKHTQKVPRSSYPDPELNFPKIPFPACGGCVVRRPLRGFGVQGRDSLRSSTRVFSDWGRSSDTLQNHAQSTFFPHTRSRLTQFNSMISIFNASNLFGIGAVTHREAAPSN